MSCDERFTYIERYFSIFTCVIKFVEKINLYYELIKLIIGLWDKPVMS